LGSFADGEIKKEEEFGYVESQREEFGCAQRDSVFANKKRRWPLLVHQCRRQQGAAPRELCAKKREIKYES